MVVRDPNFWRRFSIAVHQDEAAREEMTKQPDLKHSYVPSLSPVTRSPLASPLFPAFPPMAALLSPESTPSPPTSPPSPPAVTPSYRPRSKLKKSPSTKPLLRPTIPSAQQPSTSIKIEIKTSPIQPLANSPARPVCHTRPANRSTLSLSLSGRPPSTFKFWTTITADPSCRDSWLESQTKKQRQRTWICWSFWIGLVGLVAGIVVTLLVLKSRGVI